MFLQIAFVIIGSKDVFRGHTTPLAAGFLLGTSIMLSELFFVLMCVFFVYGQVAKSLGADSAMADNAMGSFCLFNFIMYLVFAIIVAVHRDTFGIPESSADGTGNTNNAAAKQTDYPEDDEQL